MKNKSEVFQFLQEPLGLFTSGSNQPNAAEPWKETSGTQMAYVSLLVGKKWQLYILPQYLVSLTQPISSNKAFVPALFFLFYDTQMKTALKH